MEPEREYVGDCYLIYEIIFNYFGGMVSGTMFAVPFIFISCALNVFDLFVLNVF